MDQIAIHKLLAGDPATIRRWVESYQPMALSIAVAITDDHQVAEEIVQDSFLKALRGFGKFRREASLRTWFYRIVTNEALGYLRRQRRPLFEPLTILEEESADTGAVDALMVMERRESRQLISEALLQLAPGERLALRLFYLEEENLKTVAAITGWSLANTKVILHRARKHMLTAVQRLEKQKERL